MQLNAYGKTLYRKTRGRFTFNTLLIMRWSRRAEPHRTKTTNYLLAMKLTVIFLIAACLQVSAKSSAQITLSERNAPLEKVLKEIKQQSGYSIFYDRMLLQKAQRVDINVKNIPLKEALTLVFKGQPLTFEIINNKIITVKEKAPEKMDTGEDQILLIDVHGKVVNDKGEPVAGATVTVKGTRNATATDANGEFVLKGVDEKGTLVVSGVNIESFEIKINAREDLPTAIVKELIKPLDEIVTKGYYNTSKRLNTGTVGKITKDQIEEQPVSNPLAALEGRVPGLFITQGTGVPGSNFTVRIRGQNSIQNGNNPLYIIDGVPFLDGIERLTQRDGINSNSPFNSLNPNDIESIEILKDADATSIYGSRGSNGVILITTKKGKIGKTSLDVNLYSGWGKVTRTMKYLNTPQYLQMRNEAFVNDGIIPDASNAPDLLLWDTTRYTDWKKLLIGGTARTTNYEIRFSGGSTNTQFSLGANYHNETTVFPGDFADTRNTVNFGLVHNSTDKKLSISINSSYAYEKSNLLQEDLTLYINTPPNMYKPYDSLGNLVWSENGYSGGNPLKNLLQKYSGVTDRLTANGNLSYKISPALIVKANFGYNYIAFDETSIYPIKSQNPAYNPHGSASFGNNNIRTWIAEPQMEFSHKLGSKGNFILLFGSTWQESQNKSSITDAYGYTSDNLLYSINGSSSISASNSYNQYRYQSFFGRINYNWDNKYLINLTGRRDGSSRFGPDKRFSNFGAIGAAWIISQEKFMQNLNFLSYAKLRGSYGITGNDQIGNYQYLDTWSNTQYPYQGQSGLLPSRLFNPDYSWEKNKKFETALELGFIRNRILLTVDHFSNKSSNQIIRYSLPAQVGGNPAINGTFILKNFPGVVQNEGWEFELNTTNIKRNAFQWNSFFNLTIPRNRLLSFPNLSSSSYAYDYIIGKPLNIIYQYHYLGVDPSSGIYKFQDVNNDGQLDQNDYVYGGTTDPVFYGGFGNSIQYKGFQFDFLFSFTKQKGIDPIFSSYSANGSFVNQPIGILNHWTKPGDNSLYEKYTQDFNNPAFYPATFNIGTSDAVLTDASFIRLKNISISYTLPAVWINKAKMEKCKIYIEAQNLITITNFKGADPESQNPTSLPPLKVIAAGIQIIF